MFVLEVNRGRKRLFAVLTLLLLVAFVTTLLLSYFIARDTIRKNIVELELPLTGDSIYSEIQRDVVRPVFVSDQMAHNTFLREWILNGEHDTDQLTRYLKEIKERYGAFTAFFASEATFRYYNHQGFQRTLRTDESRDKWFFRVRQMKDAYESNIDPDITNKEAITVFINYRIIDGSGKFLGTTGIGLSSTGLTDLVGSPTSLSNTKVSFSGKSPSLIAMDTSALQPPIDIQKVPRFANCQDFVKSQAKF